MRWIPTAFPAVVGCVLVAIAIWSETVSYHASRSDTTALTDGALIDPVCQMHVGKAIQINMEGNSYNFCSSRCAALFEADSARYLSAVCLVCKAQGVFSPLEDREASTAHWQGVAYKFCSAAHRDAFIDDPSGYFLHTMWGIPTWLYYSSIAIILVLSFGLFERLGERSHESRRINLLRIPGLRGLVKHPLTRFSLRLVFVLLFVFVICAGLFGSQLSSDNIAPLLTWTLWWGGLVLVILYAGSAWCYVCPWDAIADWVEGLRVWGVKKDGLGLGLIVPRKWRTIWIATLMFIALTWLELGFGVTMNPRATAWLALAILCAAFMSAFIFERKAFCRYACPVGRIIGIYSMFAPTEVRAEKPDVCRSCRTQSCYKGNATGEACPTSLYIPAMRENTNCVGCMECVKSCESDNVAFNLRPWGSDFLAEHRARFDEAALALVLVILAAFHGLTMTSIWRTTLERLEMETGLGRTAMFSMTMMLLMIGPLLLYAVLMGLSFRLGRSGDHSYRDYFIRYAYTLVPIALFYHLAHNSEHLLMEGQKIVALSSDPFGWGWNLFGSADWTLAPLVSLRTLWLIQVILVVIGHVYSLWAARAVSHRFFPDASATRSQVPVLAVMVLFSLLSLWLLKQPMEMRTSGM